MSYLIYEVNITLDADIEEDYKAWLTDHIEHILKIDGFIEANVFSLSSDPALSNKSQLVALYQVRDQKALDDYFANHAAAMRADGIEKFGDKFSASRRVYRHTGISLKRKTS